MKQLPRGWVQVSPTRYEYRARPYHPRVCGKPLPEVAYSYTVSVALEGAAIEVTINDDDAPSVQGGANLGHPIPVSIIERLLAQAKDNT